MDVTRTASRTVYVYGSAERERLTFSCSALEEGQRVCVQQTSLNERLYHPDPRVFTIY